MRPIIGCHLAVLIIIHGGFLGDCTQGRERVLEKSEDENELKYIQRKRNSGTHAAPEFSKYHVIHPKVYHTVQKHEIDLKQATQKKTTQRDAQIHDLNDLTLTFQSEGQNFIVDLHLNHQLIPDGYFQKYHKEGKHVIDRPSRSEIQLCHYNGKLRGVSSSWAALSTCDMGIQGVIYDGRELHYIEKVNPGLHYHYRGSDHITNITRPSSKDSHTILQNNVKVNSQGNNIYNRALRYKRDISNSKRATDSHGRPYNAINRVNTLQNIQPKEGHKSKSEIKGPWNANHRSRYVELLLVVDNKEYKDHGENLEKVYQICKDVANVMNALYSPLNIYIALVGVVVWTEYDEIKMSTNGDKMLTNFLHYRRERLVKDHPNDNAQLLTGVLFEGGVVGKALKGPICTYEFSGGVNMWHSDTTGLIATTVAHEMGHNFGMEHDTEECECPDERCIMAPASSKLKPTFWSSCSLEYLAMAFEHGMDYCLRNKPTQLFDGPVCGNGFVEKDEECDCGLKEHCDNPCCNPTTCKLFPNATCATGTCCDFQTCQPKLPGSICRGSEHECDLPEYCTGENEFCPDDVYKVDGTSCKMGQAFCYGGACRTHSDQCKLLWGPSGKKSDNQCYEQNRKGTRHGNCGYNRLNQSYIPCENLDVRCGMLHCSHLNERLEFGMESVAILSHSFINSGGRIIPCRTALVDLGLNDVDPGLAPEGARCSDGSLCVNRKCMPVADLKVGPNSCPGNCNGHGTCNSKGHCHCIDGYAPPDCILQGTGGSEDSGPASQPYSTPALLTFFYICLILAPLILISIFAIYHRRRIMEISKEGPPEEWRLWIENTNFTSKFKRHSDQHDGQRPSRPTSLLTNVDISGPIPCENGQSSSSSPTHALLPHVDTSTSALSTVVSDKVQRDNNFSSENVSLKRGAKNSGIFSSIAAGFERSRTKIRSKSIHGGETKDNTKDSDQCSSNRGVKRGFMETLAKSISLPSPKIRGNMKSRTHGSEKAHYEITVEHQEPRKDSGDQSPPILTPCDIDEKNAFSEGFKSAQISTSTLSNDTSKDSVDSSLNSASPTVKKVDTTVTVTNASKLITGSKSLSSFATTNRFNAPYRTTLPASKSYSFRSQTNHNKETELLANSSEKNRSHIHTEKSSSSSLTLSNASSEQKTDIKESIAIPNNNTNVKESSVSVKDKLQIDKKDRSQYPLTKKHAFPHSSTFSGQSSDSNCKTFLPSSKSCDSAAATHPLASEIEGKDANTAQKVVGNLGSNNNKGINTVGNVKKGNNDTVSGKTTQESTAALDTTCVLKPTIARKPPTPPRKPNYLKTKEIDVVRNAVSSSLKSSSNARSNINNELNVKNEKNVIVAALNNGKSETTFKVQEEHSSLKLNNLASKRPSLDGSLSVVTPTKDAQSKTELQTEPIKLEKQMPLTKTTTVPSLSNIGENSNSSLPKSSTLPAVQTTSRPLISRPVLQTATPCAASLIERAPSTGVSQSSILSGSNRIRKSDKSSKGVVFSEQLTLPSPTNPNHPPIIHQQSNTSLNLSTPTQSSVTTVSSTPKESSQVTEVLGVNKNSSTIVSGKTGETKAVVVLPSTTSVDFTPTWKTEPKALPADAFVCNVDTNKSQKANDKTLPLTPVAHSTNKDATIVSPDSDKGSEKGGGQFSKFKSKLAHVKRTPTSERHKIDKTEAISDDTRSLSPTSSLRSEDGPQKHDRANLRSLQISNPILQTAVDIKTNLLPVCRANDEIIAHQYASPLNSKSISPSPTNITSSPLPSSDKSVSTNTIAARAEGAVKSKGKAPPPPIVKKEAPSSEEIISNILTSKTASKTSTSEDIVKDNKNLLSSISRRLSNKSKPSDRRDSAPEACNTNATKVPSSPSVSSILKQSDASNQELNEKEAFLTSKDAKPSTKYTAERPPVHSKSKRPASIATTRPVRPTAPPPPRPPNSSRSQSSPTRSDTGSIASSTSSTGTIGNNKSEPIYHTIRENPLEDKVDVTSITSPLSDDFVTPTSSPIMTRRNSDTISTGSSTDGGDLMNAILKEMTSKRTEEEESVYSTLMRKKKNKLSKSTKEQ